MALAGIFAFIVLRGLLLASRNEDPFCRFATAGLVILFGIQSCINMSVNLHLMPAKGMTLPFISYGGSSMISLALAMGFLIAVTRKRPRAAVLDPCLPARRGAGRRAGAERRDARSGRRGRSCSRPAARAATCFPPRRWPARSRRAASRSNS